MALACFYQSTGRRPPESFIRSKGWRQRHPQKELHMSYKRIVLMSVVVIAMVGAGVAFAQTDKKADPYTQGARVGDATGAYTQGARAGDATSPYTRGGKATDPFTDGAKQ